MLTFRQVTKDEWRRGDHRVMATTYRSSTALFQKHRVVFDKYEIEGMGEVQSALFRLSNGKQFVVIEYLSPSPTITTIWTSHIPNQTTQDLKDVLKAIDLDCSELDWVHPDAEL